MEKKLSIVHHFQGNHLSVNHHRGRKILPSNLLHSNISTHILHTGLLTFPDALTRRICLTIKSFLVGDHFLDPRDHRGEFVRRK